MPDPTNLTSVKKSAVFRLKGLKDRLIYPNENFTPESSSEVNNMDFSERNIAATRRGKAKFNTTVIPSTEPVNGFGQFPFIAGSQKVFTTPDKVYTDNGTTRKDITGSLSFSGTIDDHVSMAFIDDKVVCTNGVDQPYQWAGDFATPTAAAAMTFASDSTDFDTAEAFIEHRNALVVLAPTISGVKKTTRILWCDVNTRDFTVDITRFLNNNRYEIGGLSSQPIIGGVDAWDKLWVMKADGVYPGRLEYRTGHIEYVPDEEVGALRGFHPIAPSTFIARPDFIFGLAREGAFIIRPDGQYAIVTKDILFQDTFNLDRLQYAVATTRDKDHQVRVLISSSANSTGHDKILVWDWETGDIGIEDYTDVKLSWIGQYFASGVEKDLHASFALGFMYNANTGSDDDGPNITWHIQTAPNDLGFPGVDKTIHSIVTYYRDAGDGIQSVDLTLLRDEEQRTPKTKTISIGTSFQYNESHLYDSGVVYKGSGNSKHRWGVNRTASSIQVRWSGSSVVKLVGYQVFFTIDDTDANTPA